MRERTIKYSTALTIHAVNVVNKPKNIDKWGMILKTKKVEEPPFGDFENMRLLNSIKVQLIKVDDSNLVVYV